MRLSWLRLPAGIPDFTGGEAESAAVTAVARSTAVVALHGPPVMRKSSTAVHFGHLVADLFPDAPGLCGPRRVAAAHH